MTVETEKARGWVRIVRDAVRHPIPLGGLVAAVGIVALGIWWSSSGNPDGGTKRWQRGGGATETSSFRDLVKPSGAEVPGPIIASPVDWSRPYLAVYSVPAQPPPPHPHPTLRDLGDNGQAHAIDFLAKDPTQSSWKWLEEALTANREPPPGEKDPFRFDRILVSTVSEGTNWNPGDRMVWTRVFVEPINFSFAGYTVAATENENINVTSVEATETRKLSAEIGLAIPALEGIKASLEPSEEHTVKKTSHVDTQVEKLGVDILPHFLRVIRESDIGGNAIGNTLVSLSMITDPITIRRRYPHPEKELPPLGEDIVLQVTGVHLASGTNGELDEDHPTIVVLPQVPVPHCALRARIWMLYEKRQIDKGGEYYEESLQTVSLIRDADERRDVDFVGADDVSPAVWSIQVVDNAAGKEKNNGEGGKVTQVLGAYIQNGEAKGPTRELVFTDYGQASKLAHWVRTHPPRKDQKAIKVGELTLDYRGDESLVPVKNIDDVCAPEYNAELRRIYHTESRGG